VRPWCISFFEDFAALRRPGLENPQNRWKLCATTLNGYAPQIILGTAAEAPP